MSMSYAEIARLRRRAYSYALDGVAHAVCRAAREQGYERYPEARSRELLDSLAIVAPAEVVDEIADITVDGVQRWLRGRIVPSRQRRDVIDAALRAVGLAEISGAYDIGPRDEVTGTWLPLWAALRGQGGAVEDAWREHRCVLRRHRVCAAEVGGDWHLLGYLAWLARSRGISPLVRWCAGMSLMAVQGGEVQAGDMYRMLGGRSSAIRAVVAQRLAAQGLDLGEIEDVAVVAGVLRDDRYMPWRVEERQLDMFAAGGAA